MNYEKKYKEALQKAKQRLDCDKNGFISTDKALLLSMFPELKESEDEKIRKELIDFLQETIDNVGKSPNIWTMSNAKKWIAWLEKQGEQKPTWSEEYEERLESCLNTLLGVKRMKRITETINTKWLRSLKQRVGWKPTEEQMKALKAMMRLCEIATSFDAYKQRVVESLYSDLKKLSKYGD